MYACSMHLCDIDTGSQDLTTVWICRLLLTFKQKLRIFLKGARLCSPGMNILQRPSSGANICRIVFGGDVSVRRFWGIIIWIPPEKNVLGSQYECLNCVNKALISHKSSETPLSLYHHIHLILFIICIYQDIIPSAFSFFFLFPLGSWYFFVLLWEFSALGINVQIYIPQKIKILRGDKTPPKKIGLFLPHFSFFLKLKWAMDDLFSIFVLLSPGIQYHDLLEKDF